MSGALSAEGALQDGGAHDAGVHDGGKHAHDGGPHVHNHVVHPPPTATSNDNPY
jgi:hypothetical protein